MNRIIQTPIYMAHYEGLKRVAAENASGQGTISIVERSENHKDEF